MKGFVRGAIAGTIATIPMTLVMTTLFRKLPPRQRYPLPPRLVTENAVRRSQTFPARSDATFTRATLIAHFGYGAATGALFPFLDRHQRPTALIGAGYGVAVWAASYLGWIPAAGLLTPATRHPAKRNALMLAAHLVWGTALAVSNDRLSQRKLRSHPETAASHIL